MRNRSQLNRHNRRRGPKPTVGKICNYSFKRTLSPKAVIPLYKIDVALFKKSELFSTAMDNNGDLFNALTCSLLVAIVSYLPFREAARTSILCKQWRSIWRETTNLEFNVSFFVDHDGSKENQEIQRRKFVEFVGHFLQNYSRKGIQRFTLSCSLSDDFVTQMKNFINFAVSHDVRELGIDFSDPNWDDNSVENPRAMINLPLQVDRNSGIESLKLFMCNFDASLVTKFGVLKNVSLGWIEIKTKTVIAMLVNCPLLESFSLKKCWGLQSLEIYVPDSGLKKLVIDKCKFIQDNFYIEGPKLKFLKYSGRIGCFQLFNQRELVEVDLDFVMEPQFDEVGNLLYDFVQEVYSAQFLTVCSVFLQMVPQGDEPLCLQSPLYVRHLILKTAMHMNEYVGIKFMLNSCPNLQILTFEIGNGKIFPDYEAPYTINAEDFWLKTVKVEKSIERSVEVVNVKGFKGSKSEVDILRYIIYFGLKLRKVNLYLSEDENRKTSLANARLVAKFQRKSEKRIYTQIRSSTLFVINYR